MMAGRAFKRKGRSVFWIAIAVICGAIGATLLLANDMRHLKAIAQHYDLKWPFATRQDEDAVRRDLKRKRLQTRAVDLPERFFDTAKLESIGTFQRQVYIPGPQLCALFNDAGIVNDGWQSSPYAGNSAECLSERKLVPEDDPDNFASFFLSVKGTPEGTIRVMRMKLMLPDTADGLKMKRELIDALKILIDKTHWTDFAPAIDKVEKLEDFEVANFGVDLKFYREFGDTRGFNLIFTLSGNDPALKRTRAYFDTSRWLPLPRYVISSPEEFY